MRKKERKPGQFYWVENKLYRIEKSSRESGCTNCDLRKGCKIPSKLFFTCLDDLGPFNILKRVIPKR